MSVPRVFEGTRQRLTLARLVLSGLLHGGVTVATGLLIRDIFDAWVGNAAAPRLENLLVPGAGLGGLALLAGAARILQRVDAERLGQDYVFRVRMALFDHLCAVTPRALQNRAKGGVLLRFLNDLTALRLWVSLGIARLTVVAVVVIPTLAVLAWISRPLAGTVAGVLLAGALGVYLLGRPLRRSVIESRRRRTYLANNVTEKLSALATVQVCGQVQRERRRVDRQSERLLHAMVSRARTTGGVRGLTESTTAIATGATVLVGVQQVAAGDATAGTVVAAVAIVGVLVPQIRTLGRIYEYWQGARVAFEKLESFFALPAVLHDAPDAPDLVAGGGEIVFDGVSLDGALSDVTATAEPGQRVAVVGPNGAGKSTLLALAARLAEGDRGSVCIDGQDVRRVTQASLHRAVGFIGPDAPLLRGTVERNLRYTAPKTPGRELRRVSRLCGVQELVEQLPEGKKTRLSEGGRNLSEGERQRIALARALMGKPRILLLDEADANLDPQAMAAFTRALARFSGTVLFVSHHIDRVRTADVVWHLDGGRLVEVGEPTRVLKGDGPTAKLFRQTLAVAS